ncbi:MAG: D-alanine--D-alanine ligase [Nitrospirales bacterium]|nr:D-alanine--D-alanine ligase [Nitrospirales bacterium]
MTMKSSSFIVGVLMGGASAERDISLKTGQAVCAALQRRGYRAVPIEVDRDLPRRLRSKRVDVAFLALHGPGGEDGSVQGLLEVMDIPFTASGVSASAIGMDKGLTRAVLEAAGVPIPMGQIFQRGKTPTVPPKNLGLPVVVKPCTQGSTIGVSIVRKRAEWKKALKDAFQFGEQVVVEQYIPGREMAVGVFQEKTLPVVEIIAPGGFYDFTAKYGKAETRYVCPAVISKALGRLLNDYGLRAYQALGCRGAARVDFRIHTDGRPFVLELNTIPGMTERSLLPMAAARAGHTYDELAELMLLEALPNGSKPGAHRKSSKSKRRSR